MKSPTKNEQLDNEFKKTIGLLAMYNAAVGRVYNDRCIKDMNIQFDRMWVECYGKL